MHKDEVLGWLRETDAGALDRLYQRADAVRREHVGGQVHLRGLVEISNHCLRQCGYCGLRAGNRELQRYKMTAQEIFQSALAAEALGYGTVVLQAGESPKDIPAAWVAGLVSAIKDRTRLAVTLSLGERSAADLALWRKAGADRYLLRFETSDRELYGLIHPRRGRLPLDRVAHLRLLGRMGYQVGSGIMVGLPGQTYESVAADLLLFRELDLDMVGIGPYIAHPRTPLGAGEWRRPVAAEEQVPNTEELVYKAIALTRILRPDANIPSTTALATINTRNGRELGLMRGANVVMPNLTPAQYRKLYELYPNKACVAERPTDCNGCLLARIRSIGRVPGQGPGGRRAAAHV